MYKRQDIHREYYFYITTLNNSYWGIIERSTLAPLLSISILPTIYQSILNMNTEFLFKILYSLIFSIFPLAVYSLSNKYIGNRYAFLASCFSMFQAYFLAVEYNPRTSLAILFVGIFIMVLFNDDIKPFQKKILLIVFMTSIVVSHYSTTYIFFLILLGAFMMDEVIFKKNKTKQLVNVPIIFLFLVLIFFWYAQVTETAFNSGVGFVKQTIIDLNMFFVEESRSSSVSLLVGSGNVNGIPPKIDLVFTWLTFAFIGIGITSILIKYKAMLYSELDFKTPEFLMKKLEPEFLMISLVSVGLLVIMVLFPYISIGYNMMRLYATVVPVLSIFFVIGGIMVSRFLNQLIAVFRIRWIKNKTFKIQPYLIILFVLVFYFLGITDVTYNIAGFERSILVNSGGKMYDETYVHDQEVYGAKWLETYGKSVLNIYADNYGALRLTSYGKFTYYSIDHLYKSMKIDNGYIYLRYNNIVNEGFQSAYSHQLVEKSEIYDAGRSKIYK